MLRGYPNWWSHIFLKQNCISLKWNSDVWQHVHTHTLSISTSYSRHLFIFTLWTWSKSLNSPPPPRHCFFRFVWNCSVPIERVSTWRSTYKRKLLHIIINALKQYNWFGFVCSISFIMKQTFKKQQQNRLYRANYFLFLC